MKITVTRTITIDGDTTTKTVEADFTEGIGQHYAEAARALFDSLDKPDAPKKFKPSPIYYAVWLNHPHGSPIAIFRNESDAKNWAGDYPEATVHAHLESNL